MPELRSLYRFGHSCITARSATEIAHLPGRSFAGLCVGDLPRISVEKQRGMLIFLLSHSFCRTRGNVELQTRGGEVATPPTGPTAGHLRDRSVSRRASVSARRLSRPMTVTSRPAQLMSRDSRVGPRTWSECLDRHPDNLPDANNQRAAPREKVTSMWQ